jgi:hypothetical protein
MNTPEMTSALGFGTLIIGLIVAIVLLLRFLRKPENRHPMEGQRERNIAEIRDEAEHGDSAYPRESHTPIN